MADTGGPDHTDGGPSLEMPSFSLRRTKKAAPEPAEATRSTERTALTPPAEPVRPVEPEPAPRQLPTIALTGLPAVAMTGVVVGALAVVLSRVATSTCDVVRGTSSCGGGPGLVILVGVLVVLAYAGSVLLRVFSVPDAGSTSVLAVGILAVLVLVLLLGSIDAWWMGIAIPVTAVIAFCGSWWVTTAVVDEP